MCGISGIIDFAGAVDPTPISAMNHIQRHRGPDSAAVWHRRNAAFGFQRLAVVDLSHGDQPVTNEDDTVHVVCNGEIYNHRALRRDLAARGHRFRSRCDVEVIPHLYEEYGSGFVDHLDGDFAIAVWDSARSRLLLTRDRVGVKPLFYHRDRDRIIFASEIKGIFASGLCEIGMDPQGLSDCLFYGHTIAPRTFWRGITDLPPATVLTIGPTGSTERRYFTPFQRADPDLPLLRGRAAVERFTEVFTEAVRKRLPDEVRAGVALSGGLDSSTIAAVAARRCDTPLDTASVRLRDEALDETPLSRLVAESLGLPNTEIDMTGARAVELLPTSLWHFESPFWYGAVATPFLDLTADMRARGLTVGLSGDGSDELLAGYDFYRLMKLSGTVEKLRLAAVRNAVWKGATAWSGAPAGIDTLMASIADRRGELSAHYGEVPPWIYLWSALDDTTTPIRSGDLPAPSPLPTPPRHDTLRRQLHFEFYTRLPHWVLPISDRLGMANSIEVRVPYLDRDVIDVCTELSPDMLVHHGTEKYVLKKSAADILPRAIVRRRKKPFMTPVAPWYLSGPGADLAYDHLSADAVRGHGIFDPVATERMWRTATTESGTLAATAAEWSCMAVLSTHMVLDRFGAVKTAGAHA
ncbi:asparagine synthase (glutamine-hydrolyzing) [Nocardia aurea]|uniref:asparagine synthase (glutamine-hydrolyzing) n=1 Tax=Nocardia aurea TaxID=2144174 RepID=UPI0033AB6451